MTVPSESIPYGSIGGPVPAYCPKNFNGLAIVGEAPGKDEVLQGIPFSGAAGQKLNDSLQACNIIREECFIGNPFQYRPDSNKIAQFFLSSQKAKLGNYTINTALPSYLGGYCVAPHDQDVRILWRLLKKQKPKVILALGNTALWALCWKSGGITKYAGQILETEAVPGCPVIATYHPSYLIRNNDPTLNKAFIDHITLAKSHL